MQAEGEVEGKEMGPTRRVESAFDGVAAFAARHRRLIRSERSPIQIEIAILLNARHDASRPCTARYTGVSTAVEYGSTT